MIQNAYQTAVSQCFLCSFQLVFVNATAPKTLRDMTQLNQKMAELLDDISNAMTEKLMAIVGQMTPADKTKLEKLLIAYETDCSTSLPFPKRF